MIYRPEETKQLGWLELNLITSTLIKFMQLWNAGTTRLTKECRGGGIFLGAGDFFWGGGVPYHTFFCTNLLVRVKLGYPPNFNFLGKHLLGEKYEEGKKEKERRRKNNAKFSGHSPSHALHSHQKFISSLVRGPE